MQSRTSCFRQSERKKTFNDLLGQPPQNRERKGLGGDLWRSQLGGKRGGKKNEQHGGG